MARKQNRCDGCGKMRNDVRTCGRDSNGDPDGGDFCFLCRVEAQRNKVYDFEAKGYVHISMIEHDDY